MAYFCQVCGEVWARCTLSGPDGEPEEFEAIHINCPSHPVGRLGWGGTFFLPWDTQYCDRLPVEVLKWEILQLARQIQAGIPTFAEF